MGLRLDEAVSLRVGDIKRYKPCSVVAVILSELANGPVRAILIMPTSHSHVVIAAAHNASTTPRALQYHSALVLVDAGVDRYYQSRQCAA